MSTQSQRRRPIRGLAVALAFVGVWWLLPGEAAVPEVPIGGAGSAGEVLPRLREPSTETSRVTVQAATKIEDSAMVAEEHVWALSFTLLSHRDDLPKTVHVRVAGTRHSAKWDPGERRFATDVKGSRLALEGTDLVVAAGNGEAAALLPVRVMPGDELSGMGTTPLRSASWDMRRLRIDAGAIQMLEPPSLGALVARTPAQIPRSFQIRWEGAGLAIKQVVDLEQGESKIELATFLPVTHWSAEAVESRLEQAVPKWSATAQAGEDIQLPPDPSTGVIVILPRRISHLVQSVTFLPLPAPKGATLSTALAVSTLRVGFGGSPGTKPRSGRHALAPFALAPFALAPGKYMVEAWSAPGEGGEMTLLAAAPAAVRDRVIRLVLE